MSEDLLRYKLSISVVDLLQIWKADGISSVVKEVGPYITFFQSLIKSLKSCTECLPWCISDSTSRSSWTLLYAATTFLFDLIYQNILSFPVPWGYLS